VTPVGDIRTAADEASLAAAARERYELALAIADDVSAWDIEILAPEVSVGTDQWRDTRLGPNSADWLSHLTKAETEHRLDRAVRYLQLRGRARVHKAYPHLVQLLPAESGT
jgi:hypothetical protein